MEGELTHVLEGHTREVLCLDVKKEAAFSGKDGDDLYDLDNGDRDFAENYARPELSSVLVKRRQFFR